MKPVFLAQLLLLRGLITVPGGIALTIWLSAFPLLWIDHAFKASIVSWFGIAAEMTPDTARSLLSTIAAAAITTLSLVYSLVLIVFTLAAGNIAPRLLKRFTSDRVNQVTAGLLGGTFLFALSVLYRTGPDLVPPLSIASAALLAVISVLQLIYFVHAVSRSVTIDEEIAAISDRLEKRIAMMVRDEEEQASERSTPNDFPHSVEASRSGYLNAVDEKALLALAVEQDLAIRLRFKPGDFIIETQPIAYLSRHPEADQSDIFAERLHDSLLILPLRDAVDDIEYSINLLIEIALRALSPGVNDTFTAIASLDRLTAALSAAVRMGLRGRNLTDREGTLRVEMPGLSLEAIFDTAFHPLRQAGAGNMLMMKHLAHALVRLREIGNSEARELISSHARLLLDSAKANAPLEADYRDLKRLLPFLEKGE